MYERRVTVTGKHTLYDVILYATIAVLLWASGDKISPSIPPQHIGLPTIVGVSIGRDAKTFCLHVKCTIQAGKARHSADTVIFCDAGVRLFKYTQI